MYLPLTHVLAAVGDIKRMNVCECECAYCLSRLDCSFLFAFGMHCYQLIYSYSSFRNDNSHFTIVQWNIGCWRFLFIDLEFETRLHTLDIGNEEIYRCKKIDQKMGIHLKLGVNSKFDLEKSDMYSVIPVHS